MNGQDKLLPSNNDWDWLGGGIYFWEQDPVRGLQYSIEVASGKQYNKKRIKTPFLLGAVIELGECLNLVEAQSLSILKEAHSSLKQALEEVGESLPINKDAKRTLDCAVIRYVHETRKVAGLSQFDTIRSAFDEGQKVYDGSNFSARGHIQVCVINSNQIKGYFLPLPLEEFNPYLKREL